MSKKLSLDHSSAGEWQDFTIAAGQSNSVANPTDYLNSKMGLVADCHCLQSLQEVGFLRFKVVKSATYWGWQTIIEEPLVQVAARQRLLLPTIAAISDSF